MQHGHSHIEKNEPKIVFSGDNPKINPAEDMLDYAPFSRLLAQSISRMSPKEGIVISINGPWGSGKSTALNFILYYLEHEFAERPVIPIHFAPWWFSGRENLTRLLISQLRARLGDKDYAELKGKLADFADLVTRIPGVPGKDAGEFIADRLRGEPDLVSLKNRIDELLRDSDPRILVIIDDIDRLAPDEICDLFRTIKATGKFPNVIYLLAFDIEVVVQSLEQTFITDGNSYLEKIVQVPFTLPSPDKSALRKFLFDRLSATVTDEANFDEAYWVNVYFTSIDHFIVTPRHVIRLTNALQATYPSVMGEVNNVDFIAIEAIRVFMPKLYDKIRRNQDLLTGISAVLNPDNAAEQRKTFESWLELIPNEDRDYAKRLLSLIFPRFGSAFGNAIYGSDWLSNWRRKLRVCSPDKFPIFFRFTISLDSISTAEINALLEITRDSRAFGESLLEYAGKNLSDGSSRVRAILENLQDYTRKDISEQDISSIVDAFFDIGDKLLLECDNPRNIFDTSNDIRISRLLYQLLRRIDEAPRFGIVSSAISKGSALAIIVHETAIWGQEHGKFGVEKSIPEEQRTFTAEHLKIIEDLAVGKINKAAEDGYLISSPKLVGTLYAWNEWTGSHAEARKWANKIIATDYGLTSFVEQFGSVRLSQGFGDLAVRKIYRLDPKLLEPFIDPNQIVERLRHIKEAASIDAKKMKAVSQFLHEYDLRINGKDPDSWENSE